MKFHPDESRADVERCLTDIKTFVETPQFEALVSELRRTPQDFRLKFVEEVILRGAELTRREIRVPDGMLIQKSAFADGRPTLFCVSKYLPDRRRKVTITYDDA